MLNIPKKLSLLLVLLALVTIVNSTRLRAKQHSQLKATSPFIKKTDTKVLQEIPLTHNTRIYLYNAQFDNLLNCKLQAVKDTDDYWTVYFVQGAIALQCRDGYWLSASSNALSKSADYSPNTHWISITHPIQPQYFCLKHSTTDAFLGIEGGSSKIKSQCLNWERFSYLEDISPTYMIKGNPHKAVSPVDGDKFYLFNPYYNKYFNCYLNILSEPNNHWTIHASDSNQYLFSCSTGKSEQWLGAESHQSVMKPQGNDWEKWELKKVTSQVQVYCLKNIQFKIYLSLGDGNANSINDECKESEYFSFVDFHSYFNIISGSSYYVKGVDKFIFLGHNSLDISTTEGKQIRFYFLLREENHWVLRVNVDGKEYYVSKDGKLVRVFAWDQATKDQVYMKIEYFNEDSQKICIKSAAENKYLMGNQDNEFKFMNALSCGIEESLELSSY